MNWNDFAKLHERTLVSTVFIPLLVFSTACSASNQPLMISQEGLKLHNASQVNGSQVLALPIETA